MTLVPLMLSLCCLALPTQAPTQVTTQKTYGDVMIRLTNVSSPTLAQVTFAAKKSLLTTPPEPSEERIFGKFRFQTLRTRNADTVIITLEKVERFNLENTETVLFAGPATLTRGGRGRSSTLKGMLVVTVYDQFDPTDLLDPVETFVPTVDRVTIRFFVPEQTRPVYEADGEALRGDAVVMERNNRR